MLQMGGSPGHRKRQEKRDRVREISVLRGFAQGITQGRQFPKATDCENKRLIIMSFYGQQTTKTGVLEVCTMADIEPCGHSTAPVEEGRGPGADVVIRDSPGRYWERQFPLLWVYLGKIVLPFRKKRVDGRHCTTSPLKFRSRDTWGGLLTCTQAFCYALL